MMIRMGIKANIYQVHRAPLLSALGWIDSLHPPKALCERYYHSAHLTDKETEAQGSEGLAQGLGASKPQRGAGSLRSLLAPPAPGLPPLSLKAPRAPVLTTTSPCSLRFPNTHSTLLGPSRHSEKGGVGGVPGPLTLQAELHSGCSGDPHSTSRGLSDTPREAGTFPEGSLPQGIKQI